MPFGFNKPPYYRGVQETWVLDKPNLDLTKLKDVSKSVWFERGYGVTTWRKEGTSNWDTMIGNLAKEDGTVNLDPRIASRHLDLNPKWVVDQTNSMLRNGLIRNIQGSSNFHLTLTKERQPSDSPELQTIPLIEYPSTPHCYCSTLHGDVMFLGCITCRQLALFVIKSYYGNYWLEVESAVTRRESKSASGTFDISKVNESYRPTAIESIGKLIHLVSKSAFLQSVDTSRLFWLVSDAQNRIHINPQHFAHHQSTVPAPDRQFLQEVSNDEVRASGRKVCPICDSPNSKSNNFCGKCGSAI